MYRHFVKYVANIIFAFYFRKIVAQKNILWHVLNFMKMAKH